MAPRIVHLGVGSFHRSHQAMYVDRLRRGGSDWGICAVGVTDADRAVVEALSRQGGRYTLVLRHPDGSLEQQRISSITEVMHAPDDREAVIRRMADPSTRIVSLTITEGGYTSDDHGVFAMLAEALRRRDEPFTVMSCDNVEGNGEVTRQALLAAGADVAGVCFPSSMVDRITPATTPGAPVVAEPFVQWVLEDRFSAGRPAFENVGVHLVEDVRPYELMKLRLLNAGHQALAYAGLLLGHRLVHDAARDPRLQGLLQRWWEEALPTLPPVPGIDLASYRATLLERFGNPHVEDTLERLGSYAADRLAGFVLPVVRDNLAAGRPVGAAALVVAAWLRCTELRPLPGHGELDLTGVFRDQVTAALTGLRADVGGTLIAQRQA